jgi:hypothetical protein
MGIKVYKIPSQWKKAGRGDECLPFQQQWDILTRIRVQASLNKK